MEDLTKQSLMKKLKRKSLSLPLLREGITECFILTNRQFFGRRMGATRPQAEIDATTKALVQQVYAEVGASAAQPTLGSLCQAWHTLDRQLGFEAEPELLAHHHQIIGQLFELAEMGNQT